MVASLLTPSRGGSLTPGTHTVAAAVVCARGSAHTAQATAKRLSILTDVVKTANSILEPRKVIELIMAKIQQLIPCEAWSMLMVDEEKQELVF